MVGKNFDVVYDDFSGGHFVGQVGTHQPRNTWMGADVGIDPTDGCLLPLPDLSTFGGVLSGDTAANCTVVLMVRASGLKAVWAGNTSVYTMDVTGTVTSAALGSAAAIRSLPCYFADQDRVLILDQNGTSLFSVNVNPATPVVTSTTALPTTFIHQEAGVIVWGAFVIGYNGAGKIYFSNPSVATTWTATDWFAAPYQISRILVHNGNLYIAAASGWWVATGIPGSTLTLKQISTVATGNLPVSIDTSIVSAAETANSPLTDSMIVPNGCLFRELVGARDRPLSYAASPEGRYPRPILQTARIGHWFVGAETTGLPAVTDEGGASLTNPFQIWILDTRSGVWTRRSIIPASYPIGLTLGWWPDSAGDLLPVRLSNPNNIYFAWLSTPGLVADNDATYQTVAVQLAEYFHQMPFTIKEVLCEVDYGNVDTAGATAISANRSIGVQVKTPGVAVEGEIDLSLSRSTSTALTQTLPSQNQVGAIYTTRRAWVRFSPNDGSDTYNAIPVVTLTGIKLRRLIMRCQEVG